MDDELKTGARNNTGDRATIRKMRGLAREIVEHSLALEPTDTDEPESPFIDPEKTFVNYGGEVKALGNGRVGGYLVRFSGPDDPDLSGEYFTADTDFGESDKVGIYYHHGLDTTIGRRKIGKGNIHSDDIGLWVEAQLTMRDEYEKQIYALAEAGKLGWSSGTAGHIMDRDFTGKATKITAWPIADASLTPTPCEPRNGAIPLKSLLPEVQETPEAGEPAAVQSPDANILSEPTTPLKEETEMELTQEQLNAMIAEAVKAALPPVEPAPAPATKAAPVVHMSPTADNETAIFLKYVRTGDLGAAKEINQEYKTENPFEEGTSADGGIVVPNDFYAQVIEKRNPLSVIRQAPGAMIIQTNSKVLQIGAQADRMTAFSLTAETSGTAGIAEGDYLADKSITLYKFTKRVLSSAELLSDARVNIESYFSGLLGAAAALTENTYVLTGTGNSQPQGVTVGGTTYTGSSVTTYGLADIVGMFHALPAEYHDQAVWVTSMGNLAEIRGLTGNAPYFLPMSDNSLVNGLMGRRVLTSSVIADSASAAKSLVFGNFGFYAFAENGRMAIQRNPYLLMNTDQVAFYARVRFGGLVAQAEAMRYLTHPTA